MQRKTLLAALIAILNGTAYQAHAYSVTVVASRPVEQQVVPRMEAIKGVLSDILSTQTATGTAINQNSEKLASVIAQNGQATRQQMIFSNETQRLEEARKASPCQTPSAVNPHQGLQQKAKVPQHPQPQNSVKVAV